MFGFVRRRKGRILDDEFFVEDLEGESDEDFRVKRGVYFRKNSNAGRKNEIRISRRVVRVLYVESDGSEEVDDDKNKKF